MKGGNAKKVMDERAEVKELVEMKRISEGKRRGGKRKCRVKEVKEVGKEMRGLEERTQNMERLKGKEIKQKQKIRGKGGKQGQRKIVLGRKM